MIPAERTKLLRTRKDKKATKEAADKKSSSPKKKDNDDQSTSGSSVKSLKKENTKLKDKLKSMMNAFVSTIDKEDGSDLSSKEGSNSIQAGIALLQEASPMLAEYISMAHKAGNLTMLDLREVWLLDSQTTHNL